MGWCFQAAKRRRLILRGPKLRIQQHGLDSADADELSEDDSMNAELEHRAFAFAFASAVFNFEDTEEQAASVRERNNRLFLSEYYRRPFPLNSPFILHLYTRRVHSFKTQNIGVPMRLP